MGKSNPIDKVARERDSIVKTYTFNKDGYNLICEVHGKAEDAKGFVFNNKKGLKTFVGTIKKECVYRGTTLKWTIDSVPLENGDCHEDHIFSTRFPFADSTMFDACTDAYTEYYNKNN